MSGDNFLRAAYGYLYLGDFQKATEAFGRAIEADPDNPSYYYLGSVTAMRNGDWDTAVRWARRATELAPRDPMYNEHARLVEARGEYDEPADERLNT